ncbi:MAG TPA: D-2-hydroxyacid dehydrogenase [Gemmatimonadales bacterium]|nr:D-2-hydroxyacid dehydrogenase [Gemmatimonadales bacterium]
MTARRLVVDLASPRAAWRIPPARVAEIGAALPQQWELVDIRTPASSDGDGASGSGSPEAVAAAQGAEIYIGYGIAAGVAAAGKPTLRWVHSGTAGIGSSIAHLRGTGIQLTNSAGVHAEPMADWVLAAIAYFARGLDRMVVAQREGRWAKEEFADHAETLPELRDIRVGILGLGGIGTAVARRALALGMPVAGVRRHPPHDAPDGVRWVGGLHDLPRLAAESDCLVIAAPHTAETAGAVTREVLERLPRRAVVVNVSRGSLLDETALLALLDSGHLRGAALDVFATEPLPAGHPFWRHPRVLMSPHVSGVTSHFWERETALIIANIKRYLAGAPLTNLVDLDAGY